MAQRRPNIILINCDDLGYGDLGCYGSPVNQSPAIDALAARGIRLTDFYMASPVCSPSRGGMLTGCYPARIGFGSFDGDLVLFPGVGLGLAPDEHTVAARLRDLGYATMLVGKWHCGDQPEFLPTNHGFDDYFGIPYSNDMGMQARKDGSYNNRTPLPLMRGDKVHQEQPDQAAITERYVDECVQFLDDAGDTPFFGFFGSWLNPNMISTLVSFFALFSPLGRAAATMPSSSRTMAPKDWYRDSRGFCRHLRIIASMSVFSPGRNAEGRGGALRR